MIRQGCIRENHSVVRPFSVKALFVPFKSLGENMTGGFDLRYYSGQARYYDDTSFLSMKVSRGRRHKTKTPEDCSPGVFVTLMS